MSSVQSGPGAGIGASAAPARPPVPPRRGILLTVSGKGQKLLEEALTLPPDERADLAAILLGSLHDPQDEAADEAWDAELKKRIDEVESGAVKTIPWSEARARFSTLRDARKRS